MTDTTYVLKSVTGMFLVRAEGWWGYRDHWTTDINDASVFYGGLGWPSVIALGHARRDYGHIAEERLVTVESRSKRIIREVLTPDDQADKPLRGTGDR